MTPRSIALLGLALPLALQLGCGSAPDDATDRAQATEAQAHAPPLGAPSPATPDADEDDLSLQLLDPELSLETQDGHAFHFADLAGHPVLLSFFYASCDTMCPLIVSDLRAVESSLDDATRAEVRIVLVTIDPSHDSRERLREVMRERHLSPDRWTLVRGTDADVRTLASTVGMNYRVTPDGFAHNATLLALDGHGVVRAQTLGTGRPIEPLVEAIRAALRPPS